MKIFRCENSLGSELHFDLQKYVFQHSACKDECNTAEQKGCFPNRSLKSVACIFILIPLNKNQFFHKSQRSCVAPFSRIIFIYIKI